MKIAKRSDGRGGLISLSPANKGEIRLEISITPQRRMRDNGVTRDIGVRLTMVLESENKAEKEELDRIWENLEADDSVEALLDLITKMNKKKG